MKHVTGTAVQRLNAAELGYLLGERKLGRLATVGGDGMPHVVPIGWAYNDDLGTIDISGHQLASTRKFRNVQQNPQAAFVVDDVLPPWQPRSVMVQGPAEALDAPSGRHALIRIWPEKIISWGLDT